MTSSRQKHRDIQSRGQIKERPVRAEWTAKGCKAGPLRISQSKCAPTDLLCITRPRCAGDIMTYKRKRVEKFHPSISSGREQTAVPFEEKRGLKRKGGIGRGRGKKLSTRL
ncbi:uncharacterized [Tachysurus ichikawai]